MFRFLAGALIAVVMTFSAESIAQPLQMVSESRVRTYYVAADEVEWDYAPGAFNKMLGMKFEGNSKVFTERGPHRIGTVYRNDGEGNPSFLGSGFTVANTKFSINGYIYGTGPMMTMKQGEHVRWYLLALGEFFSLHTPHWHGNTVLQDGKRTDVVALLPAQMVTVDMIPDNPGIWMFHCHIDDHMEAGMAAFYKGEP